MLLENFTYPEDTRVRNEAETLAAAGLRVTVIAPRGSRQPSRESLGGVEVRRYRTAWAGRSMWTYAWEYGVAHLQLVTRSLTALLRGASILHINGPPDTLAVAGMIAHMAGGKVVYDMHDSGPELFEAKFGSSFVVRILVAAQLMAIRCADQVIVTNDSQRDLVTERGKRPARDVTVVRNGPRIAEFPDPAVGRSDTLADPRLIYVGTLDVQDGVLELADLMSEPELAAAHLTIVGDGPARKALVARIRRMGAWDRVTFTGHVPHERVAKLISGADIAVDPAPGTEFNHGCTMIKVVEYMSAGRPTVAYDLRETRRAAKGAAVYAPCRDRQAFAGLVCDLARDSERRLLLGRLARTRAATLTWERSADALRDVYRRLA